MASGQKIGLVVEGGGMKCAYSAGVLDGFMDAQLRFDYCIGVSAGSGNVASFVAGQRGRNLRFFTTHTHSPDYFGLKSFVKTGDLFGLQYIYGDLTNSPGPDPLDYDAFVRSPAVYQAAVTNALTGKPEYFGKETIHSNDFRLLMASCAMPVFCRPVELYGVPYFDGGLIQFQLPWPLALLLAGLAAALFAYLIGLPVLRLRSDYLAIATLGFAEILRAVC